MNKKVGFETFGLLEWLDPQDYLEDVEHGENWMNTDVRWKYLCSEEGDDCEFYDIVYDCSRMGGQVRFTKI